jgi:hypothetical protein
MANSLKALFPALGRILGQTPAALYAHQRTFVNAGLLESTPGRGPGSGVRAAPETLAEFLSATITLASLAENVHFAKAIARAVPGGGKCQLTSAATFKDAFAAILADKALTERVNEIRVTINGGYAQIIYDGSSSDLQLGLAKPAKLTRHPKTSVFVGKIAKPGLSIEVSISADIVRKLAGVIKEVNIA